MLETSAILSGGFGHPYPGAPSRSIVRLPYRLASMLCISKDSLDRSARKEIYGTAGGPVGLYLLPDGVHVELVGGRMDPY